jgi:hypothetical protein
LETQGPAQKKPMPPPRFVFVFVALLSASRQRSFKNAKDQSALHGKKTPQPHQPKTENKNKSPLGAFFYSAP